MMNSTSTVGRTARLFQFNLLAFLLAIAGGLAPSMLSAQQDCVNMIGDLTMGPNNEVIFDIDGTTSACDMPAPTMDDHDAISSTGTVALGGAELSLNLGAGFTPTTGNMFTLIEAMTITDEFAQGDEIVVGGRVFDIDYNTGVTPNTVVLSLGGIQIINDTIGICSDETTFDVTFGNFPLSTMDQSFDITLELFRPVGVGGGTENLTILGVTVPANSTSATETFDLGMAIDADDFDGGTIQIDEINEAGTNNSANFIGDPTPFIIFEAPAGTIAITTMGQDQEDTSTDPSICPGDDLEVTFMATAGSGLYDLTFEVDDANGTQTVTFDDVASGDPLTFTEAFGNTMSDFEGDITRIELVTIADANRDIVNCTGAGAEPLTGMPLVDATDNVIPAGGVDNCPDPIQICEDDVITYTVPTFTDNCTADTDITVTQTSTFNGSQSMAMATGGPISSANSGVVVVSFAAEDEFNNVNDSCSFTITITDTPDFTVASSAQEADVTTTADCSSMDADRINYVVCSGEEFDIEIDPNMDSMLTNYTILSVSSRPLNNVANATTLVYNDDFDLSDAAVASDTVLAGDGTTIQTFTGSVDNFAGDAATGTPQVITFTIQGEFSDTTNQDAAGMPTVCQTEQEICVLVYPEVSVVGVDDFMDGDDVCNARDFDDVMVELSPADGGDRYVTYSVSILDPNSSEITVTNEAPDGQINTATETSPFTDSTEPMAATNNMVNIGDFNFVNTGRDTGRVQIILTGVYEEDGTNTNTQAPFDVDCSGPSDTIILVIQPDIVLSGTILTGGTTTTNIDQTSAAPGQVVSICDGDSLTIDPFTVSADSALFFVDFTESNTVTRDASQGLTFAELVDTFTNLQFQLTDPMVNGLVTVEIVPFLDLDGDGEQSAGDCIEDDIVFRVRIEATPSAVATALDGTICEDTNAEINVTIDPNNVGGVMTRFNYEASTNRPDSVTVGDQTGNSAVGLTADNDPNTADFTTVINNIGRVADTVTFAITPFTFGADGANDNGMGDDCVGDTAFVDVVVEPIPAISEDADLTQVVCNLDASDVRLPHAYATER